MYQVVPCKEGEVVQPTNVYLSETTDSITDQSTYDKPLTLNDAFYAYSFGAINFLELLDILEVLLNVPARQKKIDGQ
jgi:hypothetical protein